MRRPWVLVLSILLVIAFLYVVLLGLGMTGRKKGKQPKRVAVLNDFEDPAADLQWATAGYVMVETSTENITHGKRSAHMSFLLPKQFFPTPTPGMEWKPTAKVSHKTVTPLAKFDWSGWETLSFDVFNPADAPISATVAVTDARGYKYESPLVFLPKKVTNAAVSIALMQKERLDITTMSSLSLQPDVTNAVEPVELYVDYLRLEGQPPTAPKKKK
jgi:hypothetical protein